MARRGNGRAGGGGGGGVGNNGGGSGGGNGGGNNGGGRRGRGVGRGSGSITGFGTEIRGPVGNPPLRTDLEAQVMPSPTTSRRMLRSLRRGLWFLFGCIIGLFNFCFKNPYVAVNTWILRCRPSVRQFLYCTFHLLLLLSIISLSASIYHGMQLSSENPMPKPAETNVSCSCNQTTSPTANFSFSGNTSFKDGFYWSVVTITTVGFGDIVPQTDVAKLVTCLLVFVGLVVMTMVSQTVNEAWSEVEEYTLDSLARGCPPDSHFRRWLTSAPPLGRRWWHFRRITIRRLLATLYSLGCMLCGMVSFRLAEEAGLLDAFYATVTTESTVGFGDKSFAPSTESGKMAASFWILLATSAASRALELQVEARLLRRSLRLLRQELTLEETRRIQSKEGRSKKLKEFLRIKYRNARLFSPEHETILNEQFLRCCPVP